MFIEKLHRCFSDTTPSKPLVQFATDKITGIQKARRIATTKKGSKT